MASQGMSEISCSLVGVLVKASYRAGSAIDDLVEGQSHWNTG